MPAKDPGDCRFGEPALTGNLKAGHPQLPHGENHRLLGVWGATGTPMRSRTTVPKPFDSTLPVTSRPLRHRRLADTEEGSCLLQCPSILDYRLGKSLSTLKGLPCVTVIVHALDLVGCFGPSSTQVSQLSFA
jgi:hypothetical protein